MKIFSRWASVAFYICLPSRINAKHPGLRNALCFSHACGLSVIFCPKSCPSWCKGDIYFHAFALQENTADTVRASLSRASVAPFLRNSWGKSASGINKGQVDCELSCWDNLLRIKVFAIYAHNEPLL